MRTYVLQREQRIPRPIDEVFDFFADARNLEAITPPWLRFRILTPEPIAIGAGAHLEYQITWRWLAVRWLTEIRSWEPPNSFMDVQLCGPYRLWEHTHTFEAVEGGTFMRDVVRYSLPLGPLGRLAHGWFVKADLDEIFDFRGKRISEVFACACSRS